MKKGNRADTFCFPTHVLTSVTAQPTQLLQIGSKGIGHTERITEPQPEGLYCLVLHCNQNCRTAINFFATESSN